jgi:hypothetical protein
MIADKINELLKKYPHCGLSYYGDAEGMGHTWWLNGMTPVGMHYAIQKLKQCGEDVSELESGYALVVAERERSEERARLRENFVRAFDEYIEFVKK